MSKNSTEPMHTMFFTGEVVEVSDCGTRISPAEPAITESEKDSSYLAVYSDGRRRYAYDPINQRKWDVDTLRPL